MSESKEEKLLNETVKILTEYEYEDHIKHLYEMAGLDRKRSGLKVNIWVDESANNVRKLPHDTNRLKLGISGEFEVEITIDDMKIQSYYPSDLYSNKGDNRTKAIKEGMKYIKRNKDLFKKCLDSVNEEYTADDLKEDLRKRGEYK